MKTNVYIDGLNLYYRAVQGTQYKWLDIDALLKKMFPRNTIYKIKYFTSLVSSRPNDPGKPIRQQIYLRALRTFPNIGQRPRQSRSCPGTGRNQAIERNCRQL